MNSRLSDTAAKKNYNPRKKVVMRFQCGQAVTITELGRCAKGGMRMMRGMLVASRNSRGDREKSNWRVLSRDWPKYCP
jgi:hypothetical protein